MYKFACLNELIKQAADAPSSRPAGWLDKADVGLDYLGQAAQMVPQVRQAIKDDMPAIKSMGRGITDRAVPAAKSQFNIGTAASGLLSALAPQVVNQLGIKGAINNIKNIGTGAVAPAADAAWQAYKRPLDTKVDRWSRTIGDQAAKAINIIPPGRGRSLANAAYLAARLHGQVAQGVDQTHTDITTPPLRYVGEQVWDRYGQPALKDYSTQGMQQAAKTLATPVWYMRSADEANKQLNTNKADAALLAAPWAMNKWWRVGKPGFTRVPGAVALSGLDSMVGGSLDEVNDLIRAKGLNKRLDQQRSQIYNQTPDDRIDSLGTRALGELNQYGNPKRPFQVPFNLLAELGRDLTQGVEHATDIGREGWNWLARQRLNQQQQSRIDAMRARSAQPARLNPDGATTRPTFVGGRRRMAR